MNYTPLHDDGGPVPHIYHRRPSNKTPGRWYVSVTGHRYPPGDIGAWDLGFTDWQNATAWATQAPHARREHATA